MAAYVVAVVGIATRVLMATGHGAELFAAEVVMCARPVTASDRLETVM